MIIPKVEASIIPLKMELAAIYNVYDRWAYYINDEYPSLRRRLKGVNTYSEKRKVLGSFFTSVYRKQMPELKRALAKFNRHWPSINDKVMLALSSVMEREWSERDRVMRAYVSVNPICPRDIKTRSFHIYYKMPFIVTAGTCVHELSHFLYFEKWKDVFPNTDEREFDPHTLCGS